MLEAYGIFFTAPTIFLFSFFWRGDIIYRYHRDIWRARTQASQARPGLAFTIHTRSLNKYIPKKKCEYCLAFIGGMRGRRLGIPARPFPTSATQAGHIVQSIRFQLSPFWHKCLTQSERSKCPKYTLCTSCSLMKNLSQWLGEAGIRRSSHKILYHVISPLPYQSYLVMVI